MFQQKNKIFEINNLKIVDFENSHCPEWIVEDVVKKDIYGIKNIEFKPDDIILDIGANVGIFSVYMAKLHPDVRIIGLEPAKVNFKHFRATIRANNVKNVETIKLAITSDGRRINIATNEGNPGGSTIYSNRKTGKYFNYCSSITLDDFITKKKIEKIKLLKCDVESSEHEVFMDFKQWGKIEYIGIEIHEPRRYDKNYSKQALLDLLQSKIPPDKLAVSYA